MPVCCVHVCHQGQKKELDSPTAHELELQMVVVIHYVRAAKRTWILYKSSHCS